MADNSTAIFADHPASDIDASDRHADAAGWLRDIYAARGNFFGLVGQRAFD